MYLISLFAASNKFDQDVVSALLSLHKVLDQLPRHLLRQYRHVDLIVVAAGEQGWEQDSLQLWLTEVLEGKVGKLLEHRWLTARLDYGLVVRMISSEVSTQHNHQVEQLGLVVMLTIVEEIAGDVSELQTDSL